MASAFRKTGISVVGDVPWGTHFCHFYETKQDLLDTLVPYFKAGLESKEYCLWVISDSELITVEEAKGALARGYDGLRASGDTFWLAEKDWKDFFAYEKQVNDWVTAQPMTVLCTYPLAKSGAAAVLDVVQAHQFVIARRQGEWEVVETPELKQAKAEISRLNEALEQRVIDRTNELGVANEELRKEITERKQAEDELRRQKEILQKIFDHIPVMINFVEADGHIKLVNREWERTLGWSLEEIRQQNLDIFAECYPDPQYRQEVLKFVAEAKGKWADFKTRVRDGRVIDTTFVRVHLSDGTSIGIGKDITERKQAEEALDERLRFETLLTELSAAFANLTTNEVDLEIDKWLQTLAEFLGVDRASFFQFGEDWTTLYRSHSYTVPGIEPLPPPPIGMKEQFPWITDQLRRGVIVKWSRIPDDMPEEAAKEKEYAAKLGVKSGLNIPVLMGGSVICAITFTSIITYHDWPDAMVARLRLVGEIFAAAVERKRAEAALRKSEEQFRQMAENIREVFWLTTADLNKMLYISPAYEAVWGQSSESLYREPRSFFAAIHPEDRPNVVAIVERDREQGFEVEYRVVRPEGSIRHIRDRGFPIRDESGRFYRVAGIAEDITERKRAEEKLKTTSEQLRALTARLRSAREEESIRIAREIHDELGSMLTSLKWDLEEIQKTLSTPVDQSQLAAVREKLSALMNLDDKAISALRRIASDLRPSVLDDLGLVAAIEWQAQQFQARTGIVCVWDCSLEKVELTEEQSTAVFRIFQETLTNILRHAQATRVDIKLKKDDNYFVLSISDDGKGITEQEKSEQQSLGILGMRERAYLIGGEIDIQGVAGKGTVVIVRVPLSGQERVLKATR